MKTAALYIRVSTDEQADKGYSQRSQQELLEKYCEINDILVRRTILEDHSAKTFLRPEWQKYLRELGTRRNQTDLLLFLKWDRFSRNAGDAYEMIKVLRTYGIEPQAIEQPLDLTIPENKMMLAFYLAAPEVENDRRALNVIHGMRRASKEGRFMAAAPFGYLNKTREDGRKYIAVDDDKAWIVQWVFEKISEGVYNTEQVWKLAKEKGFNKTRDAFWGMLRNPTYCGKIVVKKYKDEERHIVKGLHDAIISDALFEKVQDVLDGRKRGEYRTKIFTDPRFPLRGFLICPNCGHTLTASSSKGRNRHYDYYHCAVPCLARFRTTMVEQYIINEFKKYTVDPELIDVYTMALRDAWNDQNNHSKEERKQLILQMRELENKLSHIRELLSSRDLEPSDYKSMKAEYVAKLEKLEMKLTIADADRTNIEPLLKKGISTLFKLDTLYASSGTEMKRQLIGSMYPEKLIFDGISHRTARINEAVQFIYLINNDLQAKKKRMTKGKLRQSAKEPPAGIEPATY